MDSRHLVPTDTVDHIVPKRWGGRDERRNLQGLCTACHNRKTMAELRLEPGLSDSSIDAMAQDVRRFLEQGGRTFAAAFSDLVLERPDANEGLSEGVMRCVALWG